MALLLKKEAISKQASSLLFEEAVDGGLCVHSPLFEKICSCSFHFSFSKHFRCRKIWTTLCEIMMLDVTTNHPSCDQSDRNTYIQFNKLKA
jgi:hypothetical protein